MALGVRGSQVHRWLSCPSRAAYEATEAYERDFEQHVGARVGEYVHQEVTGHHPSSPKRIIYDSETKNEREMKIHARKIADKMNEVLEREVDTVIETEVPVWNNYIINDEEITVSGTVDMVCTINGKRTILDIKTGMRRPTAVWTQVNTYAYLYSKTQEYKIEQIGYLWVVRMAHHLRSPTGPPYTFEVRPYVEDVAESSVHAAVRYAGGHRECYPNPSDTNCYKCPIEETCPMR